MSKEAMKLALEVLENAIHPWEKEGAITALREALAKQPAQQDSTCSNALRIQHKAYPRTCKKCGLGPCVELAQQALDKKAENARELGLDYEPAQWQKIECPICGDMAIATDIPAAQRKPLTTKEIREWWASENGLEDCAMSKLDDFEQVVRAIEAAHNIKENT